MNSIFLRAGKAADKVRISLNLDMFEPINIYDSCEKLGLTVRFVDINMEGMYMSSNKVNKSSILISNKRPLVRRSFTCAHELGHHYFKHGTRVDALEESNQYNETQKDEELSVNAFAGFLLMPIAGVLAEFAKRKWNPNKALPIQYYLISSHFGVGYHTLIYHCRANRVINFAKAKELLKYNPAKIFKTYFSKDIVTSHYKIFDKYYNSSMIEVEVLNYLIFPKTVSIEGNHTELILETKLGNIYKVLKVGIIKTTSLIDDKSISIRIQKKDYVGLSENRHL